MRFDSASCGRSIKRFHNVEVSVGEHRYRRVGVRMFGGHKNSGIGQVAFCTHHPIATCHLHTPVHIFPVQYVSIREDRHLDSFFHFADVFPIGKTSVLALHLSSTAVAGEDLSASGFHHTSIRDGLVEVGEDAELGSHGDREVLVKCRD